MNNTDNAPTDNVALSKEAILAAADSRVEWVPVPEWKGGVYVRNLTAAERDEFERAADDAGNMDNGKARLVSLAAVDKAGNRIFSAADVVALGAKSASAIARIFVVAKKLSGWSKADLEETAKNS